MDFTIRSDCLDVSKTILLSIMRFIYEFCAANEIRTRIPQIESLVSYAYLEDSGKLIPGFI